MNWRSGLSRESEGFNNIKVMIEQLINITAAAKADILDFTMTHLVPNGIEVEYIPIPDAAAAEAKHGRTEVVESLDYNPSGTAIPIDWGRVLKERRMAQVQAEVEAIS
jgi:hypothetical protein